MNNRSGVRGPKRLSTPIASNAGKIVPEWLFRSIAAVTSLLRDIPPFGELQHAIPGANNRPLSWCI